MSDNISPNNRRPGRPKTKPSNQDSIVKLVEEGMAELSFLPVPAHRIVKSAFWASLAENPIIDPLHDKITLALALRITGDARLNRWWSLPGFQEWFSNKDEFRQRVEYLANLALDVAEEILLDRDAHPNARVNMTKLVIEAANKLPARTSAKDDSKYLDAKVATMSREQLEEFIKKQTKALLPSIHSEELPETKEEVE